MPTILTEDGMTSSPLPRRLAAALRIAHHIPGRVRLKRDVANGRDLEAMAGHAKALHRALIGLPGIRSVSLNALALSCTIEYDPARIPPSAWPDFLKGEPSLGAEALLRIFNDSGLG